MARKRDHRDLLFWETNWRQRTIDVCESANLSFKDMQRILEDMRVHGMMAEADANHLIRHGDWDLLGLVPTFMRVPRLHTLTGKGPSAA